MLVRIKFCLVVVFLQFCDLELSALYTDLPLPCLFQPSASWCWTWSPSSSWYTQIFSHPSSCCYTQHSIQRKALIYYCIKIDSFGIISPHWYWKMTWPSFSFVKSFFKYNQSWDLQFWNDQFLIYHVFIKMEKIKHGENSPVYTCTCKVIKHLLSVWAFPLYFLHHQLLPSFFVGIL